MKMNDESIQYKGEEYKLVFNLNVMQDIQEQYGSIDEWGEVTGAGVQRDENGNEILDAEGNPVGVEPDAKSILFGLTCMLNEGIDIYNEEHETDRKPLTQRQVGRMMTDIGLQEISKKMHQTVINSTTSDEPKNE